MEVIAKREVEGLAKEEAQEEVEDHEAPEIRKSKRLARGKAKVIYPRIPKKDLLKLDEVPRKKRKLLDTSSAAAATVGHLARERLSIFTCIPHVLVDPELVRQQVE